MSNKNIIIGIVVALIVIVAIVLFAMQNNGVTNDANTVSEDTSELSKDPSGDDTVMEEDGSMMEEDGSMTEDDGSMMEDDGSDSPIAVHTVSYTNDGFSPATLTIAVGDTVSFVNNSSRDFWPASAVHPTHANYPEKTSADCAGSAFDACERVSAGSSWSFTFNETGTWKYHDHLGPNETGTIIVQ